MQFEDIVYEKNEGIATITINRPQVRNAFRTLTVDELIAAFQDAWWDHSIGVVILTGEGDKAFCAGGDQSERSAEGYDTSSAGHEMNVEALHNIIRNIPKPVIAAVNGFAIGGGHVLHVLCDISLAAYTARFGQTGPRVGSFDAGYGSAYLARVVGEKKARALWDELADEVSKGTKLTKLEQKREQEERLEARACQQKREEEEAAAEVAEEFVLADLLRAREALDELTGKRTPDDVLRHIFERFCIGK